MSEETIKQLFTLGTDSLLALALLASLYFLTRGRGKQAASEAETLRKREENEGKILDIMGKNADTLSAMKDGYNKLVDLQADAAEWHKKHNAAIEDTSSAIVNLTKNVKERSELDGEAINELREDISKRVDSLDNSIAAVQKDIEELRKQIDQLIDDKLACADLDSKLDRISKQLDELSKPQSQPATVIPQAVVIDGSESKQEKAG